MERLEITIIWVSKRVRKLCKILAKDDKALRRMAELFLGKIRQNVKAQNECDMSNV